MPLFSQVFENTLEHEVIVSERLRMAIIAGLLGFILAAYLFAQWAFPQMFIRAFGQQLPFWLVPIFTGAMLAYELAIWYALGYLLRRQRQPPLFLRYINAFVETSALSLVLVAMTQILEPVAVLTTPPILVYMVFILLATLRLDWELCVFTGLVAAGEYALLAWFFTQEVSPNFQSPYFTALLPHLGRVLVFAASGVLAGLVAQRLRQQLAKSLRAAEERNQIVGMFGQYVSPAVVDRLLTQNVAVSGEVRQVCVMFLDIRDFTTFAENRAPTEVVDYLNYLFSFMIEVVNQQQGIVNKFLGDGFMAIFGAPVPDGQAVHNAVAAALEILERVAQLNAAQTIPPTRVGIGLHCGEAVTGSVGSSQRKEYTIIGDVVNLAARIEQLNKQFDSQLLVSEEVWRTLQPVPPVKGTSLGPVTVKGRAAPVQLYRLA